MKKKLFIILIIIFSLFGFVLFWWNSNTQPVDKSNNNNQTVIIPKGTNTLGIGQLLYKKGLIKDPLIFLLVVQQGGLENNLQAGLFHLSTAMSPATIAEKLTKGSTDIWITIPEGKRASEIAEIFKKDIPTFENTWEAELEQHEGYLFPDTYLISNTATIEAIIIQMTDNFEKKFAEINNKTILTRKELVTIASLIEREAQHDADRPIVSSIIHNRLEEGMPLQIDATIQYALGYNDQEKTWWKKGLTIKDLKLDSPYNTYLYTELPPTPIANPGLEALQAAAKPANTNYLYYISDNEGNIHPARTLQQHNANIEKYGL